MTVSVLIDIIGGHGLSPHGTTLKFDVVDVDTGVDDIDINALSTLFLVNVLVERAESQLLVMADPSKSLRRSPRGQYTSRVTHEPGKAQYLPKGHSSVLSLLKPRQSGLARRSRPLAEL